MHKIKTALKILTFSFGLFLFFSTIASAEVIKNFDTNITVNTDSSISIIETIVYDSEGLIKHGIYRDIIPRSAQGKKIGIINIKVFDTQGNAYEWKRESIGGSVRIKIGDPDTTFSGEKTYVVSYTATNAVSFLEQYDELYWNVTGNNWPFAINDASATIILPQNLTPLQSACYSGPTGSTGTCTTNQLQFSSTKVLLSGEGMTVAVGFSKGVVVPHEPTFLEKYGIIIISVLVPLLFFLYLLNRWKKYGRDPKGTGTIVPQYEVPEGLTPMEVGIIIYEKSRSKDITAEIIYLATKGYIKIHQTNKKILGAFNDKDYELMLLKQANTLLHDFDRKLLGKIFSKGSTVILSSLKDTFYTTIPSLFNQVRTQVLNKKYYTHLPKLSGTGTSQFSSMAQLLFFVLLFLFPSAGTAISILNGNTTSIIVPIISGISCILMFFIFQSLMPAKSTKGVATYEYLLGLKKYLQVAEKDRLNFHNAPAKNPELFETLLPYAMVLGVEKAWAKEFDGIYTRPPSWYEGSGTSAFNAGLFVGSMSNFSTAAVSSFTSAPRSSGGSGGSGFSGGGGGGGGGGSW